MEAMGIKPTDHTYNQLMLSFAKNRDIEMVVKLNEEATQKHQLKPSKYRFNNLMVCYAKLNKPVEAENVLREMIDKGIQPDIVIYTTLIDSYKRVGNIDRCWEIFEEARTTVQGVDADEMLLSYMVRLAGATHDSEKALRIFTELETDGFTEQAKPYNSIISALGSTARFAPKAIEYWH